jgi:hypothetical protein
MQLHPLKIYSKVCHTIGSTLLKDKQTSLQMVLLMFQVSFNQLGHLLHPTEMSHRLSV